MATKQEDLDKLNTAINTRLTGGVVASYRIGDVNVQYDPIDKLFAERDRLQKEINAGKNTRNYVSFGNP